MFDLLVYCKCHQKVSIHIIYYEIIVGLILILIYILRDFNLFFYSIFDVILDGDAQAFIHFE